MTEPPPTVPPPAPTNPISRVLGGRRRAVAKPTAPTQRRGPAPARRPPSVTSSAFTMVAIVCLWVAAQMLVLGTLSHDRAQNMLYDEFRTQLAGATAPIGPVVEVGAPVALLQIPRVGIDEVIVEGTASGDLLVGPGHKRDTVLPGQVGVALVYGRAATYGKPFQRITELRTGDSIDVTSAQGEKSFTVLGVRRSGDPLPAPPEPGVARLTLVTGEGEGRLGAITPDTTVYVDAEAEEGFAAPAGRPTSVPPSEESMATDPAALPLLALCLALLLALTLAVIAARQRWATSLVWVVASPLAIALAWATTDVVMRILPNLI
jgi:sortase A